MKEQLLFQDRKGQAVEIDLFSGEQYNRTVQVKSGSGMSIFDNVTTKIFLDVGCSYERMISKGYCEKDYACNATKAEDGRCTLNAVTIDPHGDQ